MIHLTRNDFANALQLLASVEAQAGNVNSFARAVVLELGDYVASELTTLSVCDLFTGHCQLVGLPGVRLGTDTIAMPLFSDQHSLVSVVLNRRRLDFSERDRERLELVRPHLAFLYCHARQGVATPSGDSAPPSPVPAPAVNPPGLTAREGEVMRWLARGKTDAEIAALLSISPRTVQKHLEHIYVKLGVETRTAAVMRSTASLAIKNSG
ncbi:helix-turn-helix transcriptional regulator [Rhodoferax sp.]|uniref:helix-turn-helix transcriptional regulator n=1 Tax=Rhodoferax sp. TaxID=50421 RepID=UPI0025DF4D39|nr:helix-turn-helix transcriptional regulator [Rhodoferax sp.]MCM2341991.1 helix-turn-helix transcriptional regulator [Rhodoferax sp.]